MGEVRLEDLLRRGPVRLDPSTPRLLGPALGHGVGTFVLISTDKAVTRRRRFWFVCASGTPRFLFLGHRALLKAGLSRSAG